MKISKKRLAEIIKEECGYAMRNDEPGGSPLIDGEIDQEGRMAKRQLSDITKYSSELSQMLQDETQLEAWVQSKLTKAADYIKTVKHYVEYGMEEGAYDEVVPQNVEISTEMPPEVPEMVEMEPIDEDTYEF